LEVGILLYEQEIEIKSASNPSTFVDPKIVTPEVFSDLCQRYGGTENTTAIEQALVVASKIEALPEEIKNQTLETLEYNKNQNYNDDLEALENARENYLREK
jgi:hypothetical protein